MGKQRTVVVVFKSFVLISFQVAVRTEEVPSPSYTIQ